MYKNTVVFAIFVEILGIFGVCGIHFKTQNFLGMAFFWAFSHWLLFKTWKTPEKNTCFKCNKNKKLVKNA